MNFIYPRALRAGDQVCLIDPANAFTDDAVREAGAYLCSKGLKVVISEDMAFKRGTSKERARRLNHVIRNPKNKGILCIWGGYGTLPLLDLLDYGALRENRPVFAGYSDITAMHLAIAQKTGLVTFHGPSLYSPVRPTTEEAKDYLIHMLMDFTEDRAEKKQIHNLNREEIEVLNEGCCEGQLTGGNLTLISRLMGTPYEIDTKSKILFFEEIGEKPYRLHGMLTQLKMAGKLDKAAGIIVGALNNCDDEGRPGSGLAAVKDVLEDAKIPVVYNLRAGHIADSLTLPLHAEVRIEGNKILF